MKEKIKKKVSITLEFNPETGRVWCDNFVVYQTPPDIQHVCLPKQLTDAAEEFYKERCSRTICGLSFANQEQGVFTCKTLPFYYREYQDGGVQCFAEGRVMSGQMCETAEDAVGSFLETLSMFGVKGYEARIYKAKSRHGRSGCLSKD